MISQREARRLKKRVDELEQLEHERRAKWITQYPGVCEIMRCKWDANEAVPMAVRTARKLRHFVIAIADEDGTVRFMADAQKPW